jgi:glyoxylase-like metal-dependent hydrolase (beta-lactamase superfamily II)
MDLSVAGIDKIEVPLPGTPLKSVNSYVIRGRDRYLIVDTGMNRPECRDALLAGLANLNVDARKCDFFITHLHMDHLGLAAAFAGPDSRIIMGRREGAIVDGMRNSSSFTAMLADMAISNGLPRDEADFVLHGHPGVKYRPQEYPELYKVEDGDTLEWGEFIFECIETPGHTPGHMCLYERSKRVLLSGDHILGDITPNISALHGDANPLDDFLKSLDKVRNLDVDVVLPGHRNAFGDMRGRIRELEEHHAARARETLECLRDDPSNAYQVASRLTWDIRAKDWEHFPVMQKWFATGEAAAHLKYLEGRGQVRSFMHGHVAMYEPSRG